MECIKKVYEQLLMKKINTNGGNAQKAEQIWENLEFLTTEITNYDEVKKYLPLQVKKMLIYILDPKYRKEFTVTKSENSVTCECKIYWSEDESPAGIGLCKKYLSQIFPNQGMPTEERDSIIESSCRSLALSQAITDAGIGLQFSGEAFDSMFEKLELEDFERLQERKNSGKVPEVPPTTTKATPKSVEKTPEKEASKKDAPVVPHIEPDKKKEKPAEKKTTAPAPVEETMTTAPANSQMSVEEARKVVADIGTYAGNDLGIIYDKAPKSLIWLVNANSAVKDACLVLINNDDVLKGMMK